MQATSWPPRRWGACATRSARSSIERSASDWYEEPGNAIDEAALTLCRLRRARGGEKGGPEHGDEAVRQVLGDASSPALVWLASRAISYMDETGFPEAVEPWFPTDARP